MALSVWQANIVNDAGDVLPAAQVEVRRESDNALVSLFADVDGVTPKTNPFFADINGFAQFYAASGLYKITATAAGGGSVTTWRNVDLKNVATTAEAQAGAAGKFPDAAGVRSAFEAPWRTTWNVPSQWTLPFPVYREFPSYGLAFLQLDVRSYGLTLTVQGDIATDWDLVSPDLSTSIPLTTISFSQSGGIYRIVAYATNIPANAPFYIRNKSATAKTVSLG